MQIIQVLSTKSTNHNIDYNHYNNQFKGQTLDNFGGLVSGHCFKRNLTRTLQQIYDNYKWLVKAGKID